MKLKKENHLEEAKLLYAEMKSSEKVAKALCSKYGIEYDATQGRKIRKWLENPLLQKQEENDSVFEEAKNRVANFGKKYYFITAAQNATKINKKLWENMLAYASELDATIEVIPLRFKNPTTLGKVLPNDWWDGNVKEYMIANRHKLHKEVEVIGDVKIQLTASTPLSGFEGLTSGGSAIIGHPRQHFKTIPVLENEHPKFIISTGVVTEKNYTDSKVGKKGEFHHCYGFVIVESIDDNIFTFRQVSAEENGTFYDLDYKVSKGTVKKNEECVDAVILGDLHLGEHCTTSLKATYNMLERFKPKNVVIHDIIEGYSVNPHDNPFVLAEKENRGKLSISEEIEGAITFLKTVARYNPVVVKSNHDIFLDRFLLNDWRKNHAKNDYLKYAYLKTTGELDNGILPYEIKKYFGDRVVCLTDNESYKINNVELALHGHLGASGSRGGITQFKMLNTKMVVAHTHAPRKEDGCTYVGTLSKLRMGYNRGLSGWANSNVILHKNGKSQNLIIQNGHYTSL